MRFTPDILRKHAEVLVEKEIKRDRSILAAYLRGSLLYGSPLIDGVGDIDLVFIHNAPLARTQEIRPLTPEIHFDIEHHDQDRYRKPREVRIDPWLGPSIHDAEPLHDPRHFLDYTQAGVRSNFMFPENILARTKPLLEHARQFWLDRQVSPPGDIMTELPSFLEALENVITAVSLISGPPLPRRRLGTNFPDKAQAAGAPGLALAFSHLLGGISVSKVQLNSWIKSWSDAISQLEESMSPTPILAQKKTYYLSAIHSSLRDNEPIAVLWPLLSTWTDVVLSLPDQVELQSPWIQAITVLGFAGKDYQIKLAAFDSFLEICETLILGSSMQAEP